MQIPRTHSSQGLILQVYSRMGGGGEEIKHKNKM